MIIKALAKEDIEYVMNNLWQRGRRELAAFGWDITGAKEKFYSMLGQKFAEAYYAIGNGECCAICTLEHIEDNRWRSWFIATEKGFRKIWYPLTHYLKKETDQIVKEGIEIEVFSMSNDIRAYRWFLSMNFKYSGMKEKMNKYLKAA